jgi:hypothetical protein
MNPRRKLLMSLTCILAAVALLAPAAFAQGTNASITGIITDASGGVIPNATVTATNTATGVARSVTTNEAGVYTISPLIPGSYDVKVTTSGFKTKVQTGIVLETGSVVKVDASLEVGAVTESVEVSAQAAMLQTQETSVAGVVTQSQL